MPSDCDMSDLSESWDSCFEPSDGDSVQRGQDSVSSGLTGRPAPSRPRYDGNGRPIDRVTGKPVMGTFSSGDFPPDPGTSSMGTFSSGDFPPDPGRALAGTSSGSLSRMGDIVDDAMGMVQIVLGATADRAAQTLPSSAPSLSPTRPGS